MQAMMRSACGGSTRCFATNAIAFSFQSVMTSADAVVPRQRRKAKGAAHRAVLDMANLLFPLWGPANALDPRDRVRVVTSVCGRQLRINGKTGIRLLHFLQ